LALAAADYAPSFLATGRVGAPPRQPQPDGAHDTPAPPPAAPGPGALHVRASVAGFFLLCGALLTLLDAVVAGTRDASDAAPPALAALRARYLPAPSTARLTPPRPARTRQALQRLSVSCSSSLS